MPRHRARRDRLTAAMAALTCVILLGGIAAVVHGADPRLHAAALALP